MDDLDRLAFRLVRTVRNSYPHLLAQGFTLTDLEERLVPFRDARREMSDNGPEAWEITMLRLVSGERGYLTTDADLQLACRQALTLPSPTVALVRPWSNTTVTLGATAVQLGTERVQASPTDQLSSTALNLGFSADTFSLATPSGISGSSTLADSVHSSARVTGPTPSADSTSSLAKRVVTPTGNKCGCRFCGGKLPEGRKMTFCPHCGVNLTVRQCPACSTELDVNWRFCVTCGRGADLPELPGSISPTPQSVFS